MTTTKRTITEPEDWWQAFDAAAQASGLKLAAWLGEAGKAQLPKEVASQLSQRPAANRPKKPTQNT